MQETRNTDLIAGSRRLTEEGHGNPFQHSCLEHPMDRGVWQATVHRVAKSHIGLKWLSTQEAQPLKTQWSSQKGYASSATYLRGLLCFSFPSLSPFLLHSLALHLLYLMRIWHYMNNIHKWKLKMYFQSIIIWTQRMLWYCIFKLIKFIINFYKIAFCYLVAVI